MNFENWISYRYMVASKGRFLSFLNFISIAGVAVGVTALIVVTGIMSGFGNNLRDKIIGTTAHIAVEKETGIHNYQDLEKQLKTVDGVIGTSAYIQGSIFLESNDQALGLMIRGVDPQTEKDVTKVNEYLTEGHL